jgi:uncharacterized membrane protein YqiK
MADAGFWGVMTIFGIVAVIAFMFFMVMMGYKRCASDEILVVYGKVRGGRASRCIHGGALTLP